MSVKVKFHVTCESLGSSSGGKTTIRKFKTMSIVGESTKYVFPEHLQPSAMHSELVKLQSVKSVLAQLDARGKFRNIMVTLTEDLKKLYFDPDENPCFSDVYLAETAPSGAVPAVQVSTETQRMPSLKTLVKDMVVEKYAGKSRNAASWLSQFEKECLRMEIPEVRFSEVVRLFLECAASDWYAIELQISGLEEPWSTWRLSFLDTFGTKGWSDVVTAFSYRYISGSLADYALRKLHLLLQADNSLSVSSRVNLVVVGLPPSIRDKIDRSSCGTQGDLLAELNSKECYAIKQEKNRSSPLSSSRQPSSSDSSTKLGMKQCDFCTKAGFPGRIHARAVCWNNPDSSEYKSSVGAKPAHKGNKTVNNVELQDMLNNSIPDSKN